MSHQRFYLRAQRVALNEIRNDADVIEAFVPHWAFENASTGCIGDFKMDGVAQEFLNIVDFFAYAANSLPHQLDKENNPSTLFFMERVPFAQSEEEGKPAVAGWRFRVMYQGRRRKGKDKDVNADHEEEDPSPAKSAEIEEDAIAYNGKHSTGADAILQKIAMALTGKKKKSGGSVVPLSFNEALLSRVTRDVAELERNANLDAKTKRTLFLCSLSCDRRVLSV